MVPRPLKPDAGHAAVGNRDDPFSTAARNGERIQDEQECKDAED